MAEVIICTIIGILLLAPFREPRRKKYEDVVYRKVGSKWIKVEL